MSEQERRGRMLGGSSQTSMDSVVAAGYTIADDARANKPSAKLIRAHHDASLTTGGERLPTRIRARFAVESRPPRRKPQPEKRGPVAAATRAGKRVPKRAKRAAARAGHPGRARD